MERNDIVLFDCFGLFAKDPMVTYFRRHYGEAGATLKDQFCQDADRGGTTYLNLHRKMEQELGLKAEDILCEQREIAKPNPEMFELVHDLRRNHRVYLVSNCMDGAFESLFPGIDFGTIFDGQFRSYQMHLIKPEEAYFRAVIHGLRDVKSLIFYDDNPENVAAANRYGIPSVLFESVEQCKADLKRRGYRF